MQIRVQAVPMTADQTQTALECEQCGPLGTCPMDEARAALFRHLNEAHHVGAPV